MENESYKSSEEIAKSAPVGIVALLIMIAAIFSGIYAESWFLFFFALFVPLGFMSAGIESQNNSHYENYIDLFYYAFGLIGVSIAIYSVSYDREVLNIRSQYSEVSDSIESLEKFFFHLPLNEAKKYYVNDLTKLALLRMKFGSRNSCKQSKFYIGSDTFTDFYDDFNKETKYRFEKYLPFAEEVAQAKCSDDGKTTEKEVVLKNDGVNTFNDENYNYSIVKLVKGGIENVCKIHLKSDQAEPIIGEGFNEKCLRMFNYDNQWSDNNKQHANLVKDLKKIKSAFGETIDSERSIEKTKYFEFTKIDVWPLFLIFAFSLKLFKAVKLIK